MPNTSGKRVAKCLNIFKYSSQYGVKINSDRNEDCRSIIPSQRQKSERSHSPSNLSTFRNQWLQNSMRKQWKKSLRLSERTILIILKEVVNRRKSEENLGSKNSINTNNRTYDDDDDEREKMSVEQNKIRFSIIILQWWRKDWRIEKSRESIIEDKKTKDNIREGNWWKKSQTHWNIFITYQICSKQKSELFSGLSAVWVKIFHYFQLYAKVPSIFFF